MYYCKINWNPTWKKRFHRVGWERELRIDGIHFVGKTCWDLKKLYTTLWKILAVSTQLKQLQKESLCDAGAVLYQLSYQANWELVIYMFHIFTFIHTTLSQSTNSSLQASSLLGQPQSSHARPKRELARKLYTDPKKFTSSWRKPAKLNTP